MVTDELRTVVECADRRHLRTASAAPTVFGLEQHDPRSLPIECTRAGQSGNSRTDHGYSQGTLLSRHRAPP
jgi:hypothetical protein